MAKVLLVMGSDSDLPVMKKAAKVLLDCGIEVEAHISSAHRLPEKTAKLAKEAEERGFSVIIAGAGMAAHLPGVLAAQTVLPVIGVPIRGGALGGVDALYSIVQMPKGIPVATVAVDGAHNAGLLAAQIIATFDPTVKERLHSIRKDLAAECEAKDERLQVTGLSGY